MERIKKALEKAREDRESDKLAMPALSAGTAAATNAETEIRYSKTKVVRANESAMQNSRILINNAEPDAGAAFKMLRTQVLQRMVAKGWNALAITSPGPGDGKTVVASNLAISLARELHHTVLLVDLDLRNPQIHRSFGLNIERGLSDYLKGNVSLGEIFINPGIERLVILPGREPMEFSSELLAAPQMRDLVQEMKSRYPSRFVLFDLPPILAADDALAFAPFVDATLLVVREKKTTRRQLEQAMEMLRDVNVLGTVLNGSSERISAYY